MSYLLCKPEEGLYISETIHAPEEKIRLAKRTLVVMRL